MPGRKLMGSKDTVIILILLCAALLAIFAYAMPASRKSGKTVAVITVDGETAARLPLDEDAAFAAPNNENVIIEIKDGACAFIHSDCPDQICVQTGSLTRPGQSAACLPNRVIVQIERTKGDAEGDVDAVAG